MALFSSIIFDLDGTLVDSKPGLQNSLAYMLSGMGLTHRAEEYISLMIGPPIQSALKDVFGFNDKQVETGVRLFREYYGQRGLYEGEVYPGIQLLLEELICEGVKLYVATSKKTIFVPEILRHFELDSYFDDLEGAGNGDLHTKAELITRLMDRNRIQPAKEVLMIGDTKFDVVGGKANEIATLAVGYGFGNRAELQELNPDFFANDVDELTEILLG
ncbi:HAD hydrolase-like protein [Mangrovibacterium sp.]|uniref:HAD hydrolase-like protein n=1 Tax=Mangrovibacterium sp. TaxID=1961364 RepID=UPI0035666E62